MKFSKSENIMRYRIAAAVLIGGRSTRMGKPKENVIIEGDGRTFLERICDEVDACIGGALQAGYLSLRRDQDVKKEGYINVEDDYDDIGPIGGIGSVLKAAGRDGFDAVLFLACDLIRYDRVEINKICERYRGEDVLMARTNGCDLQPLASIYSVAVLDIVRAHIAKKDYRIRSILNDTINAGFYDTANACVYENRNSMRS